MNYKNDVKLNGKTAGAFYSLFIALFFLVSLFGGIIAEKTFEKGSFGFVFSCSFFSIVSLFIVLVLIKTVFIKDKPLLGLKKFSPKYLLSVILISTGMFFGLGFVNTYFADLFNKLGLTVKSTDILIDNEKELICFIVSLCLLPSVFEELFFRGVLLSATGNLSVLSRALFGGLFFALYHMSASQFFYQFVYGIVLTLIAIKSGSTVTAILCHFINNLAVIVLYYLGVTIDFFNIKIILLGLVLLSFGTFTVLYFGKSKTAEEKNNGSSDVKNLFLYGGIGMAICILVSALNMVNL